MTREAAAVSRLDSRKHTSRSAGAARSSLRLQDIFFHFLSVGRSLGRAEHRRPAPADRLRRERSRGEPFPCRPWFRWNGSSTVAGSSPMVRLFQLRRRGRCHGSPPMTVTRDTTPLFVWFSPGPALEVQTANAAIGAHYGVLILPPSVASLIVFCRECVTRWMPAVVLAERCVLCNRTRLDVSLLPLSALRSRDHNRLGTYACHWIMILFETRRWHAVMFWCLRSAQPRKTCPQEVKRQPWQPGRSPSGGIST